MTVDRSYKWWIYRLQSWIVPNTGPELARGQALPSACGPDSVPGDRVSQVQESADLSPRSIRLDP